MRVLLGLGGWSHSMDWQLHQAREIITKVIPPVTNQNFKINLWEGTQLLCDGQVFTNSVLQTNTLTVIPTFFYGSPQDDPKNAHVEQLGNLYYVDLNEEPVYGVLDATNPAPVVGLEDMNSNSLSTAGITYETNQWMEVYEGNGATTRFGDSNADGIYWATDKNWRITSSSNNVWTLHLSGGEERVFNADV